MVEKIINGKKYLEQGNIYCPEGTSWEDLKAEIKAIRDTGLSVRVVQKPIVDLFFHNTHMVTYYQEVKENA